MIVLAAIRNTIINFNCITHPVFLINSYGAPLAQRTFYLALHISLFGPVVQLIMIILSLTFSYLAQDVFSMAHTNHF